MKTGVGNGRGQKQHLVRELAVEPRRLARRDEPQRLVERRRRRRARRGRELVAQPLRQPREPLDAVLRGNARARACARGDVASHTSMMVSRVGSRRRAAR